MHKEEIVEEFVLGILESRLISRLDALVNLTSHIGHAFADHGVDANATPQPSVIQLVEPHGLAAVVRTSCLFDAQPLACLIGVPSTNVCDLLILLVDVCIASCGRWYLVRPTRVNDIAKARLVTARAQAGVSNVEGSGRWQLLGLTLRTGTGSRRRSAVALLVFSRFMKARGALSGVVVLVEASLLHVPSPVQALPTRPFGVDHHFGVSTSDLLLHAFRRVARVCMAWRKGNGSRK